LEKVEVKETIHKRAKIITIERPLWPPPPIDAVPDWCYINTLIFHDPKTWKNVWEQEIPECEIYWHQRENGGEECSGYFHGVKVFKDGNFGWQLHLEISHSTADLWLDKIMQYVREEHILHFNKVS